MLIVMKVKAAMLAGALAAPVLAAALAPAPSHDPDGALHLASASFSYRAAGDFSRDGRPVEGPLRKLHLGSLIVMKRQVTVAEYSRCVDDGAPARETRREHAPEDRGLDATCAQAAPSDGSEQGRERAVDVLDLEH